MPGQLIWLLVSLIGGAVGGYAAGAWFKKLSFGAVWNSIVGVIGGVICGPTLAATLGAGVLVSIVASLAGGGVFVAVAGLLKPEKPAP